MTNNSNLEQQLGLLKSKVKDLEIEILRLECTLEGIVGRKVRMELKSYNLKEKNGDKKQRG